MKRQAWWVLLVVALVVVTTSWNGAAAQKASGVDARADRILREMGEYLKTAGEFSFHQDMVYDVVLTSGQMIQFGGRSDVSVRRPDRLRAEYDGDERNNRLYVDGSRFTIYDLATNVYAVYEVPAGLDTALDAVFEKVGYSVPTSDLVYANPYAVLIENVQSGFLVGRHAVGDTPCHHLAFSQESIDWQIWIEDGPQPVPRKLVITYKSEPGSPQHTSILSNWNFQPRLSESYFHFQPPAGADEIEILPVAAQEGGQ